MIWEGNQEIEEEADNYSLTFLHIDCTSDKKKDKKLPTNAWIVTYLEDNAPHYDIVMGVKMDVFNCYYDRGSAEALQISILWSTDQARLAFQPSSRPSKGGSLWQPADEKNCRAASH